MCCQLFPKDFILAQDSVSPHTGKCLLMCCSRTAGHKRRKKPDCCQYWHSCNYTVTLPNLLREHTDFKTAYKVRENNGKNQLGLCSKIYQLETPLLVNSNVEFIITLTILKICSHIPGLTFLLCEPRQKSYKSSKKNLCTDTLTSSVQ